MVAVDSKACDRQPTINEDAMLQVTFTWYLLHMLLTLPPLACLRPWLASSATTWLRERDRAGRNASKVHNAGILVGDIFDARSSGAVISTRRGVVSLGWLRGLNGLAATSTAWDRKALLTKDTEEVDHAGIFVCEVGVLRTRCAGRIGMRVGLDLTATTPASLDLEWFGAADAKVVDVARVIAGNIGDAWTRRAMLAKATIILFTANLLVDVGDARELGAGAGCFVEERQGDDGHEKSLNELG